MICVNCGTEMGSETTCPQCGKPAIGYPAQNPAYYTPEAQSQPAYSYQQPQGQNTYYQQSQQPMQYGYQQSGSGTTVTDSSVLTFGILAAAFANSFYLSFLGIIFGAIAMSKAKKFAAYRGLYGKAKVGKILGQVGLIVAIVMTVLLFIWIIAMIVMAAASASYGYYY